MSATRSPQLFPISDRIVVQPKHLPEKTAGGIYIPEKVRDKGSNEGIVVAVGPGREQATAEGTKRIPVGVRVGERVMFARFSGVEIDVDGEKFLVLREEELLTVIR